MQNMGDNAAKSAFGEVQDCAEPLSEGELQRIYEQHDEKPHLTRMDEYTCFKCRARATIIALMQGRGLKTSDQTIDNQSV